jgi:hypothetical protein
MISSRRTNPDNSKKESAMKADFKDVLGVHK